MRQVHLEQQDLLFIGHFSAMASPCDVLMEIDDAVLAKKIIHTVANEAWRIEDKYSRYLPNNVMYDMNHTQGETINIDDETSRMLIFANELFHMSDGLFDVTSGILRDVWTFDGSDNIPTKQAVKKIVDRIGWEKVTFNNQGFALPKGMEIDFGGIGKEYAVDRCTQMIRQLTTDSVLINFGGDLSVTSPRKNNDYWSVGRLVTGNDDVERVIQLYLGAIATSGNAHRYLIKDNIRYGHILNPKTGWPVEGSPQTVSVAANTCVDAGMLSTLAMLQGKDAKDFLEVQEVNFWID